MKEALNIAYNLLVTFSKKTLAVLIIAIPLASYGFATLYVKHKFDQATMLNLTDRFNKLDSLVLDMKKNQEVAFNDISNKIIQSEERGLNQINMVERRMITETTSQMKFIVQYQDQNTQMLLDHLEAWKTSYLSALKDSFNIKVYKK